MVSKSLFDGYWLIIGVSSALLTKPRAMLGVGKCLNAPSDFSRISEKRRPCSYIYSAHVVKSSDPGHSRSGHQVTSSDLTSEKVRMLVICYTECPITLKLPTIDIRTTYQYL